jgi:hypothetical protein
MIDDCLTKQSADVEQPVWTMTLIQRQVSVSRTTQPVTRAVQGRANFSSSGCYRRSFLRA